MQLERSALKDQKRAKEEEEENTERGRRSLLRQQYGENAEIIWPSRSRKEKAEATRGLKKRCPKKKANF
jgi:hypothetical protein